jgi:hypothetical protein
MEKTPADTFNDVQELLDKLEKEGEDKLKQLKITRDVTGDSLANIIKKGESEFTKKTGRRMTYSEMRQTYG